MNKFGGKNLVAASATATERVSTQASEAMKSFRMHQEMLKTGMEKAKQQDLVNVEKPRFATKYIISSNKDNES